MTSSLPPLSKTELFTEPEILLVLNFLPFPQDRRTYYWQKMSEGKFTEIQKEFTDEFIALLEYLRAHKDQMTALAEKGQECFFSALRKLDGEHEEINKRFVAAVGDNRDYNALLRRQDIHEIIEQYHVESKKFFDDYPRKLLEYLILEIQPQVDSNF